MVGSGRPMVDFGSLIEGRQVNTGQSRTTHDMQSMCSSEYF